VAGAGWPARHGRALVGSLGVFDLADLRFRITNWCAGRVQGTATKWTVSPPRPRWCPDRGDGHSSERLDPTTGRWCATPVRRAAPVNTGRASPTGFDVTALPRCRRGCERAPAATGANRSSSSSPGRLYALGSTGAVTLVRLPANRRAQPGGVMTLIAVPARFRTGCAATGSTAAAVQLQLSVLNPGAGKPTRVTYQLGAGFADGPARIIAMYR